MKILKKQSKYWDLKLAIGLALVVLAVFNACQLSDPELPYLGPRTVDAQGDTVYHAIPSFSFTNQNGETITDENYNGKIYVADFFFTSCPTICPTMKSQMLRIYEHFKGNPKVGLLSHSIDPAHDTVEVLAAYSEGLGIEGGQWNLVTGDQDEIYQIAEKSYMTTALEDSTAIDEGGFVHSGAFLLIDENKNVRGHYDGTVEAEVNQLIRDMELLLSQSK